MRCYRDGQDDEKGFKDRDCSRRQKRPVLCRVSQRTLRRVGGSASVIDTEDLPSRPVCRWPRHIEGSPSSILIWWLTTLVTDTIIAVVEHGAVTGSKQLNIGNCGPEHISICA